MRFLWQSRFLSAWQGQKYGKNELRKRKRYKKVEAACTPPPQNNEFKMITNYIVVFAQVSFSATVRC